MRLCTATPNWVSFNKRATVIWGGNFFTALLGVVVVVCIVACSSSFGRCFVGVASSFSSSATDFGGVVFVFLDVFFFVVFSVILFVFCVREKKVKNFQLFYVSV